MAKEYFLAYFDYLDSIGELSDAEVGRLFKAALKYGQSGDAPKLCGNEKFAFGFIKKQIDRDNEKYEQKCEINRKNGALGGKTKNDREILANGSERLSKVAFAPKEKEKTKEKENNKENISLTTFEIYNNAHDNLTCECIAVSTQEKCTRKSTYSIDGVNYCNQHSKEILKDVETCEIKSIKKSTYGEFQNVLLSDNELEKLKVKFPYEHESYIERLSIYIASSGKKYKSHYATILTWTQKDEKSGGNNGTCNSFNTGGSGYGSYKKPRCTEYPEGDY